MMVEEIKYFFVTASHKEAEYILENLNYTQTKELNGLSIKYSTESPQIGVAVLGIAKVSFALGIQSLIDHFKPEVIFSLGFAGSLAQEVEVLDVVLCKESVQYDVYSSNNNANFDLPEYRRLNTYLTSVGLREQIAECLDDLQPKTLLIATGDNFLSDENLANQLIERYGSLIVDQETAAFYQACHYSGTQGLAIKVITDYCVGDRGYASYFQHESDAGERLHNVFEKLKQWIVKREEGLR